MSRQGQQYQLELVPEQSTAPSRQNAGKTPAAHNTNSSIYTLLHLAFGQNTRHAMTALSATTADIFASNDINNSMRI